MTNADGIGIAPTDALLIEVAGGLKSLGLELRSAEEQWQHAAARCGLPVHEDDDDTETLDRASTILTERAKALAAVAMGEAGSMGQSSFEEEGSSA